MRIYAQNVPEYVWQPGWAPEPMRSPDHLTAMGVPKGSGVTMGWLLRLVTGGHTGGRGPPTVLEFLMINFRGPDLRK